MSDWGPSTICDVDFNGAKQPIEVRINTALLNNAKEQARSLVRNPYGPHNFMDAVCIQVKESYEAQFGKGKGPRWLYFNDLTIVEKRH